MSELHKYEPYKIPARGLPFDNETGFASSNYNPNKKEAQSISFDNQLFAEIDINDGRSSSYKPAPIPQPDYPVMDEKRRIFKAMREIAWNNHSANIYNLKFYNKQTQHENSKVFYKQGVFMKDFEDDYTEKHPFSSYYPYYQLMTYEQLRTYFTWRTKVRNGIIEETSISYAFVYVYELLNNIGVDDPVDGLNKLISFRKAILCYDSPIDKYLIRWIKDYHIYYQLTDSFIDFIYEHSLDGYYPEIINYNKDWYSNFEYLSELSKYNIKKSAFYSTTSSLIAECFEFMIRRINSVFADNDIVLYNLLFQLSSKKTVWAPFKGALFYPTLKQPFKKIVLSNDEVYICSQNMWYQTMIVPTDRGKQLLGYIFKQLEAVLRKLSGYKYKLTADINSVDGELQSILKDKGISLEKLISDAVHEFHREKNKTVVSVDLSNLNRIRLEAQFTQEKLIVPENEAHVSLTPVSIAPDTSTQTGAYDLSDKLTYAKQLSLSELLAATASASATPTMYATSSTYEAYSTFSSPSASSFADGWTSLKRALSEVELSALSAVLQGNQDIKKLADKHGIMLEVLADSINEKAFDHIGDSILELDDSFIIYDEYLENVKAMVIDI